MMKRAVILLLCLFFLFPRFAHGQNESDKFATSTNVTYTIGVDGQTRVEYAIAIENLDSQTYATSYGLVVTGVEPKAPTAFANGRRLQLATNKIDDATQLQVSFDDAVVGLGQKREFQIAYTDSTVATHQGEVWEVEIPRLSATNSFKQYQLHLVAPQALGEMAFMSPSPSGRETGASETVYSFSQDKLQRGISAAFGKFQVFSFDLTYHLENPLNNRAFVEIALPPDTAYQKIILGTLDPKPDQMYIDLDGNWLAKYILNPRQRVDVKAIGHAQLFSSPYKGAVVAPDVLEASLKPTQYWQADNLQIKALAQQLKTPEAIYNYVVDTLEYDYERVKPNISRLGAASALQNPKNAICMEFTDLFVAIARAAGIPAREINGYAHAENPELQPLSLVADVLHSWAEYWDQDRKIWVPVDPTWGNTTGGVDFFHKLDLRHFAFVIHGADAVAPFPAGSYKLGANPQKDVFVSFATLPQDRDAKPTLAVASQSSSLLQDMHIVANLTNQGKSAIYGQRVNIYFDDKYIETRHVASLLPHANEPIEVRVPISFLGHNMPAQVSIEYADQRLNLPTHKEIVLLSNLSLIFLIFFVILLAAIFKIHKLRLKLTLPWKRTKQQS